MLDDQLRQAIKDSGLSPLELAERCGVANPIIYRFVNGVRGLSLSSAAKIAEVLGLELRAKGAKGAKKRP
jgi:transcriptional regulator with XRE-family HTH domain